jgi:hypothetical protein
MPANLGDLNADDDFADDDEVVYYMSNTLHNVYGIVDADENVLELRANRQITRRSPI